MLVFEVIGFGVAFAFVWAGIVAPTGLGVGEGGPSSAICCSTGQLYFLQSSIIYKQDFYSHLLLLYYGKKSFYIVHIL